MNDNVLTPRATEHIVVDSSSEIKTHAHVKPSDCCLSLFCVGVLGSRSASAFCWSATASGWASGCFSSSSQAVRPVGLLDILIINGERLSPSRRLL